MRRLYVVILAVALFILGGSAVTASESDRPAEVIVRFKTEATARQKENALVGAVKVKEIKGLDNTVVIRFKDKKQADFAAQAFQQETDVFEYVEENREIRIADEGEIGAVGEAVETQAVDPLYSQQYAPALIGADRVWGTTKGGSIVVAVTDTGVKADHPDLQGQVLPGYNAINNNSDTTDRQGHGTHVAGTIAAKENGVGMIGIAPEVKILPVKVLADNGSGNLADGAEGILWAAQNGAKVINASWGGEYYSETLSRAIQQAVDQYGVVFVAAAGNSNKATPFHPASDPKAIGIGAVDSRKQKAQFSNYGQNVDLVAPGVQILGTTIDGSYQKWDGTSMAAPNASGAVALLRAARPNLSPAEVSSILFQSAENLNNPTYYGKGLIRIDQALGVNVPAPAPVPGQPSPTPAPPTSGSLGRALADEVNKYRQGLGLAPLAWDARVYEAARKHNDLMGQQNQFSHQLPGEPNFWQRIVNEGVNPLYNAGETIAGGYFDALKTRQQWTNSAPHDAIMKGDFTSIGCELKQYPGTTYGSLATCAYAKTTTAAPAPSPVPPTPAPTIPQMPGVVSGYIYRYLFYMPAAKNGIVEITREICASRQVTDDGRFDGQVGVGCYFYGSTPDNQPPTSKVGWAYVEFRNFTPYYRSLDSRMQGLMPDDARLFKRVVTTIPGF